MVDMWFEFLKAALLRTGTLRAIATRSSTARPKFLAGGDDDCYPASHKGEANEGFRGL